MNKFINNLNLNVDDQEYQQGQLPDDDDLDLNDPQTKTTTQKNDEPTRQQAKSEQKSNGKNTASTTSNNQSKTNSKGKDKNRNKSSEENFDQFIFQTVPNEQIQNQLKKKENKPAYNIYNKNQDYNHNNKQTSKKQWQKNDLNSDKELKYSQKKNADILQKNEPKKPQQINAQNGYPPAPGTVPYFQGYPPAGYPYPPAGYPMYPPMGVPPGYPYGMYQVPPGMPPVHYPVQGSYPVQGQYPIQSQYGLGYNHPVPHPYMNMHAPMAPKQGKNIQMAQNDYNYRQIPNKGNFGPRQNSRETLNQQKDYSRQKQNRQLSLQRQKQKQKQDNQRENQRQRQRQKERQKIKQIQQKQNQEKQKIKAHLMRLRAVKSKILLQLNNFDSLQKEQLVLMLRDIIKYSYKCKEETIVSREFSIINQQQEVIMLKNYERSVMKLQKMLDNVEKMVLPQKSSDTNLFVNANDNTKIIPQNKQENIAKSNQSSNSKVNKKDSFMKILQILQLKGILSKIRQRKLAKKLIGQKRQSQIKKMLDILVRDPRKMIK